MRLSMPHVVGDGDRRTAERRPCKPETTCRVIDALDQTEVEASPWNASASGVCVVVEPQYPPGTRLTVELASRPAGASLSVFADVVHTLLVPSVREMWLTGCAFRGEPVPDEQLRPFI